MADLPDLIGAEAHRPAAVNSPTLNSWGRIGKVTSRGGSDYNHRPRHQLTVWQSNAMRTLSKHSERPPRLWRPLVFVAHQKTNLPGQVAWLGKSRKAKPCGCSLARSLAPFPQPRSTSRWRRRRGPLPPAGLRLKRLGLISSHSSVMQSHLGSLLGASRPCGLFVTRPVSIVFKTLQMICPPLHHLFTFQ